MENNLENAKIHLCKLITWFHLEHHMYCWLRHQKCCRIRQDSEKDNEKN